MQIRKKTIYSGQLGGRDVYVMPTAISANDVAFDIGTAFGNRIWFDGSRVDSMHRTTFESTFTPMQSNEKGD